MCVRSRNLNDKGKRYCRIAKATRAWLPKALREGIGNLLLDHADKIKGQQKKSPSLYQGIFN
jgi:hypothetical protein